ncbi:mitochondrial glyco protein [Crucibulum laeve]|uniref:Mitochondrial glyco protein n=1 Tax=Crucibulum laeve TaxID=68775 RepID=A0A5C3M1J0_9AGAR|nr:mitochondrial glyco protein [Crucibulum laeve]
MSAIRALRQLTATSARTFAARQTIGATRTLAARVSVSTPTSARAFSVSTRRFGEGNSDVILSQKLAEELQYEKEALADADVVPDFLKTFQSQGVWSIEDVPGNDEVTLSRKFGNETIRLTFSIADIQAEEEDFENETENDDGEEALNVYPIRASLSLTKTTGPGALNVDMICQEGHFIVENISFYNDAKLGTDLTAEADWKRRGLYIGPQFDTLDVAVQEEFEKYLQERGVNETVALFIPEYAEWKEQQEYVKWLGKVKSFIDA